jgi:vacuolar-type H+-ATPase subunit E/Vma4
MTAGNPNSQAVLTDEIIADAKRQADRVVSHARQETRDAAAKGKADAEKEHQKAQADAKAEADRRRDLILATVPIEVARKLAARIESLLTAIRDEAAGRLASHQGVDYRGAVAALAAEAISHMQGDRFLLQVAEADRQALGGDFAEEVRRRLGREGVQVTQAPEPAKIAAGVVVRDVDGRQLWDNSLESRLERFWPLLRREIGVRTSLATAAVDVSGKAAAGKES